MVSHFSFFEITHSGLLIRIPASREGKKNHNGHHKLLTTQEHEKSANTFFRTLSIRAGSTSYDMIHIHNCTNGQFSQSSSACLNGLVQDNCPKVTNRLLV